MGFVCFFERCIIKSVVKKQYKEAFGELLETPLLITIYIRPSSHIPFTAANEPCKIKCQLHAQLLLLVRAALVVE